MKAWRGSCSHGQHLAALWLAGILTAHPDVFPLHSLFPGMAGSGSERQFSDLGTKYTKAKKTDTVIKDSTFSVTWLGLLILPFAIEPASGGKLWLQITRDVRILKRNKSSCFQSFLRPEAIGICVSRAAEYHPKQFDTHGDTSAGAKETRSFVSPILAGRDLEGHLNHIYSGVWWPPPHHPKSLCETLTVGSLNTPG